MKKFSFYCFLWFLIPIQSTTQQPESPVADLSPKTGLLLKDNIVSHFIQASSGDRAFDFLSQIALWNRLVPSEEYHMAAEWVAAKAKEFNLQEVHIEKFPCDGKTEYFGNIIFDQWKVNKAELWLTSPFLMKLTSYDIMPTSVAIESTTTDVEAELVDIGSGLKEEDYLAGVKDKIVLTTSNPGIIYNRAVRKEGAAGIISSYTVPYWDYLNRRSGDYQDQVGSGGIPKGEEGEKGHFAFMISSRRADDLRNLINRGKTPRMHAVVDAQTGPGVLEVVSGVISGSKYPDEEIIVSAHLCHGKPGANDNASGCAAILEMAATMDEMIKHGIIPAPLRTIRFIWMPEYIGTYAWLSAHINDPVKIIANLNFDMVGENAEKTNSIFSASYTSDSNPSFLNAIIESVVIFVNQYNGERYPSNQEFYIGSINGTRNRLECKMMPFLQGSDHELYNSLKIGNTIIGCWPDNYYHSSEDTPDKVDPTQLHRSVVMGLVTASSIAYCDDQNAPALASLTLLYGRKRIAQSEFDAVKLVLTSGKENFSETDRLSRNLIEHIYEREKAAVASVTMFAHTASSKNRVSKSVSLLNDNEITSLKKADEAANSRAEELGVKRVKFTPGIFEEIAASLVPVTVKGKELHYFNYILRVLAADTTAHIEDIVKVMSETKSRYLEHNEDPLRVYALEDIPAYYVDGKRSILDIRAALTAEYIPFPIKTLIAYFRAFEKAGVMRLVQK